MDSYMQFSFPATGLKFYSTSTTNDPDDPAWCQQVAMTPWSMGYNAQGGQREFDCYFDPS